MAVKLEPPTQPDWEKVDASLRVVRLTLALQVAVPALALASLSKSTRALTFYPGGTGAVVGGTLMAAGGVIAWLLSAPAGVVGAAASVWLVGTAGAAIFVSSLEPTAFVKPICVECRLLPVIREHEAIHLTGVSKEKDVWDSMKSRHTVDSLGLAGDPAICSFCPIPKRLSER